MPQQSNESSAKTDAYGRIECQDCGGRFHPEPHELSGIHICGPMVVRLQATIKDLQERSEKQGKVIKDLVKALHYCAVDPRLLQPENNMQNVAASNALAKVPEEFLNDR